jgi:AcrR family transcriptional regulator
MKRLRRTQADRTAATRAALIQAGRKLFAEHGFAGVGTETLVGEAGVSRGALYHQFGDKTELFADVLANVESDVAQDLAAAMLADERSDFVAAMMGAVDVWLDACEKPEVRRILLIDGPSVLGWARWREICQRHVLGLIETMLASAAEDGKLHPLPARPLAHVLLAIADEAALYVHAGRNRSAARAEMVRIIEPLIRALVKP